MLLSAMATEGYEAEMHQALTVEPNVAGGGGHSIQFNSEKLSTLVKMS